MDCGCVCGGVGDGGCGHRGGYGGGEAIDDMKIDEEGRHWG